MRTPKRPIWLFALAFTVALASGQRALDLIGLSALRDSEPQFNGMSAIGAVFMPLFLVPLMAVLCAVTLRRYPSNPVSLFYWAHGATAKQIVWTIFFAALMFNSCIGAVEFGMGLIRVVQQELYNYAADTALNLIGSVGAIYLWLSLRAVACFGTQRKTEQGAFKKVKRKDSSA